MLMLVNMVNNKFVLIYWGQYLFSLICEIYFMFSIVGHHAYIRKRYKTAHP